jgi:hypothetical protein
MASWQLPLRFRAGVDLVQLDVTVLDATGQPARGLTPGDFTLSEDNATQRIAAFAEVQVPDAADGPSWMHEVATDVKGNTAWDGRLLLLLLDDAMTPSGIKTEP